MTLHLRFKNSFAPAGIRAANRAGQPIGNSGCGQWGTLKSSLGTRATERHQRIVFERRINEKRFAEQPPPPF